jgi:Domain of unknown function (DUF4271)
LEQGNNQIINNGDQESAAGTDTIDQGTLNSTDQFRFEDGTADVVSPNTTEPGYIEQVPEIFSGHQLAPVNSSPLPIENRTPDWFSLILLLTIAGIAYVRAVYPKIFKQLFRWVFNNVLASQTVRDENTRVQKASVSLSFVFYLVAALFLYQVSVYFNWSARWFADGFLRFLFFAFLIAFAYSFKLLIIKVVGWLYHFDRPFEYYIFSIYLINNLLGILLIPVVLTFAYLDVQFIENALWAGVIIILIAFIYRLVKGVFIWRSVSSVPLFYLILYFCTLEIVPVVIIYKLLTIF